MTLIGALCTIQESGRQKRQARAGFAPILTVARRNKGGAMVLEMVMYRGSAT